MPEFYEPQQKRSSTGPSLRWRVSRPAIRDRILGIYWAVGPFLTNC